MSEYGFCPINNNQHGLQNVYPLFTAGHYLGSFVRVGLLKLKLLNLFRKSDKMLTKNSEYDQEIPQSQTADNPVARRGRAAQPS